MDAYRNTPALKSTQPPQSPHAIGRSSLWCARLLLAEAGAPLRLLLAIAVATVVLLLATDSFSSTNRNRGAPDPMVEAQQTLAREPRISSPPQPEPSPEESRRETAVEVTTEEVAILAAARNKSVQAPKSCAEAFSLENSGLDVDNVQDSSVLMLFSSASPAYYEYRNHPQHNPEGGNLKARTEALNGIAGAMNTSDAQNRTCAPPFDRDYVQASFNRVAAAFLTSLHAIPNKPRASKKRPSPEPAPEYEDVIPYLDFFAHHEATFWEIHEEPVSGTRGVRRTARPLQMDAVYTYVNPAAPSFQRNQQLRNMTRSAKRRYNDWEELRYSLRALMVNLFQSKALMQRPAQLVSDVATLHKLGYHVDLQIRRTPWEREYTSHPEKERKTLLTAYDAPFPLFRSVNLLLSDADQVPDWLDPSNMPQLRVVLHEDMFPPSKFPGVLPTMNSNAIETGMHLIPGLSRFYLYLNNDFMIGTTVSFFDLFRPFAPPRQRLRTLFETVTGVPRSVEGGGDAETLVCADALPRSFVHMDGVMRAEIRKIKWRKAYEVDSDEPTNRRLREEESACLRMTSFTTLHNLISPLDSPLRIVEDGEKGVSTASTSVPSTAGFSSAPLFTLPSADTRDVLYQAMQQSEWATTERFTIPDPHINSTSWERGTPPTVQHHYKVTSRLHGVLPPFNLAHHPYLRDRYVESVMMNNLYPKETAQCRLAYDRMASPFSIMHPYSVITAGFGRARVRNQWQTLLRAFDANQLTAALAAKHNGTSPADSRPTATSGAALVVAEGVDGLVRRLASAFRQGETTLPMLASQVSIPRAVHQLGPLYGDTVAVHLQSPTLFAELGLWWLPGARPKSFASPQTSELLGLYDIPAITRMRRRTTDGVVERVGKKDASWWPSDTYPNFSENALTLLLDVAHLHDKTSITYRFNNLGSLRELLAVHSSLLKTPWRRATYHCLNDNFATENQTDAEVEGIKDAFKKLMSTIIQDLPPGAWERA